MDTSVAGTFTRRTLRLARCAVDPRLPPPRSPMTALTLSRPPSGAQPLAPAVAVVDDELEQGRYTRWVQGAQGQRLGESALQLAGMHCAACAGIIEAALAAVPGVHGVQVGAGAQRLRVVAARAQQQHRKSKESADCTGFPHHHA